MIRRLKNASKALLTKVFHAGQRLGFDVLPRHFYSEIPDLRRLRRTDDWKKPYSMSGVNGADLADQLRFVRQTVPPPLVERLRRGDVHAAACASNGEEGYGPVEADFLYAFVRTHRPRRVIQIGSGVSTAVCLLAARDCDYRPEITCVDPFPTTYLARASQANDIRLVAKPAQSLDPAFVEVLGAGDLFFVDSTHTLGPAGEVSRIILEMLPRLRAGVYAQFHDIYFPYDYPGNLLSSALFFGHESALLHAFLSLNSRFRLLVALSMLHHACATELACYLPCFRPRGNDHGLATTPGHFPSAAYLQAVA
jgi:hypothetical protein